jgi:hypothetical protein
MRFRWPLAIGQTRTQMALALVDPVSYRLLGVVVAWGAFLLCGRGLLSKRHMMSYNVLAVGAVAVASSIQAHLAVLRRLASRLLVLIPGEAAHQNEIMSPVVTE